MQQNVFEMKLLRLICNGRLPWLCWTCSKVGCRNEYTHSMFMIIGNYIWIICKGVLQKSNDFKQFQ